MNTSYIRELTEEDTQEYKAQWQSSLRRYSLDELLQIFPEFVSSIPDKLAELEEDRKALVSTISAKLKALSQYETDDFSKWFVREWIKANEVQQLVAIDSQIRQFKGLYRRARYKSPTGSNFQESIDKALEVPIEDVLSGSVNLRQRGKYLVGLCPFHHERTPSFFVYVDSNSCWCFGCNSGGDVIKTVQLLHKYEFKEAIKFLLGGQL